MESFCATPGFYFYPRSPCGERRQGNKFRQCRNSHFYPRSPCGERHARRVLGFVDPDISIHALLAESDLGNAVAELPMWKFLSTLSLRRATMALALCFYLCLYFYPRSPCGERRNGIEVRTYSPPYFYPRSPCGERLTSEYDKMQGNPFLSTLSLRRATLLLMAHPVGRKNFYPRSPCGERLFS